MKFCFDKTDLEKSDLNLRKVDFYDMLLKDLMAKATITSSTMAKMGKDQPVSMEVLGRICEALDCNIGDIVDYIKE